MTSETLRCSRHGRETRVRCASCGAPICPDCMVDTPVGIKCRSCAAPPRSVRRGARRTAVRAYLAAVAAGGVVGGLVALLRIPFVVALLIGLAAAEGALRVRGVDPAVRPRAAMAGAVVGYVAWITVVGGRLGAGIVVLVFAVAIAWLRAR